MSAITITKLTELGCRESRPFLLPFRQETPRTANPHHAKRLSARGVREIRRSL
jgi:hypothetical protein